MHITTLALLSLIVPLSTSEASPLTIERVFLKEALVHQVPNKLLKGVCKYETNLNPHPRIILDGLTPSYGLCQVKIATARQMGFKGSIKTLISPENNIRYAAKYLEFQYKRYHNWKMSIIAYNRGSYKKGLGNSYYRKVMLVVNDDNF